MILKIANYIINVICCLCNIYVTTNTLQGMDIFWQYLLLYDISGDI